MIYKNVSLKNLTTFRIGGKAKYYIEVKKENEIRKIIKYAKENTLPVFILGGGSDILVDSKGFSGIVIKFTGKSLKIEPKGKKVRVTAGAGMIWDDLVEFCIKKNLQGIECMSGIPGSVGAAPIQNIGAYGQELKDTFYNLTAFNLGKDKSEIFNKKKCRFAYRESVFKSALYWQKFLITSVTLELNKNKKPLLKYDSLNKYFEAKGITNPSLKQTRDAVIEIRSTKFESYNNSPNAGSFFKNPEIDNAKLEQIKKNYPDIPCFKNENGTYKCFAGWFIEQAGWKGKKLGNAAVSSKHALILTNPEKKATSDEIKSLAEKIRKDVNKKFGVNLEREVQYIDY